MLVCLLGWESDWHTQWLAFLANWWLMKILHRPQCREWSRCVSCHWRSSVEDLHHCDYNSHEDLILSLPLKHLFQQTMWGVFLFHNNSNHSHSIDNEPNFCCYFDRQYWFDLWDVIVSMRERKYSYSENLGPWQCGLQRHPHQAWKDYSRQIHHGWKYTNRQY